MLDFAFFLGVVFITFNMLWGMFTFFLRFFMRELGNTEKYILRLTQAYFLASMTAFATMQYSESYQVQGNILLITGVVVLFLYLISKIEQRKQMIQFSLQLNKDKMVFSKTHLKYDVVIAVLTVVFYIASVFNLPLIQNIANNWFFNTIKSIYATPIIGWIIGLIGIFFIVSIFLKGITAFQIISGQLVNVFTKSKSDDDFTDFEYVDEDQNLIE